MVEHKLKTDPGPFAAVLKGEKHHEYRRNDRNFSVGDILILQEYDGRYSGREIVVEVTYMTHGGVYGLPRDRCIMSFKRIYG